jgi:DNA-binding NarL/FixJ family response regulator
VLEANNFLIVGEADHAPLAISMASRLRPDICLIELELPEDGLFAINRIARRHRNADRLWRSDAGDVSRCARVLRAIC